MKLTVNNKETELKGYDRIDVPGLLHEIGYNSTVIMVKVNGQLIKKAEQEGFFVEPGDDVIAVPLVGGG